MSKTLKQNLLISLLGACFAFGVVELLRSQLRPPDAIAFTPNTTVTYETTEFTFTAHTNALGFRGPFVPLEPGARSCRIAAIGDSFTYGWGVADDQTWPAVLEQELRARGLSVEILNLGRPGSGPDMYRQIAERAIVLKPDLVLVGLLQFDDIRQATLEQPLDNSGPMALGIIRLINSRPRIVSADVFRSEWIARAKSIRSDATALERARLDALRPELLALYDSGQLNAALLQLAIKQPDYFARPADDTERAALTSHLEAIRTTFLGTEVVILSIPYRASLDAEQLADLASLGFEFDPALLVSDDADQIMVKAARDAGLDSLVVTSIFREAYDAGLYYPLDGHFTAAGQALYARSIADEVYEKAVLYCAAP